MENHIDTGPLPPPPPPPTEPRIQIDITDTMDDNAVDPHAVNGSGNGRKGTPTKYSETYLDQLEMNLSPAKKPRGPRIKSLNLSSHNPSSKSSPVSGKMGDADRRMPLTTQGLWEFLFRPFTDKIERFLESVQKTFTTLVLRDFDPLPVIHPDNIESVVEKFATNFIRQARKSWEIFLEGLPDSGHVTANKSPLLLVPASSLEVMLENIYFTDMWRQLADVADDSATALLQNTTDDRMEEFRHCFLAPEVKTRMTAIVMREVCNIALSNDTSYVLEDYFAVDASADILSRVIESVRREAVQMLSMVAPANDLQVAFSVLHMLSYGKTVDLSEMRMEGEWPLVVSVMRRYGDAARPIVRSAIAADPNLLLQVCPLFPADVALCITRPTVLEICVVNGDDVIPEEHCEVILESCYARILNQPIRGMFSEMLGFDEGALPLTLAAIYQGQRKVKELLNQKASVFSMDKTGTLLHGLIALYSQFDNINKTLSSNRTSGRTRADILSCIRYILYTHIEESEIASENQGDPDRITYQRALISAISPAGYTPLEDAVRFRCPEILTELMTLEHVTSKTMLRNARQSVTLVDMTEFERNAFLLSDRNGSRVQHKSCRSKFSADLLLTSSDDGPLPCDLVREYILLKFTHYSPYYLSWFAIHLTFMIIFTFTGLCFTRSSYTDVSSSILPLLNDSNSTIDTSDSRSVKVRAAVIAGEVFLALYSLVLLAFEMYDSILFTNCRAELRHFWSAVKSIPRFYINGKSSHVKSSSFTLYNTFRVSIILFSLFTLTALIFRLCGFYGVVVPYGVALVLGWLLAGFFFGFCKPCVLVMHLFPEFVKFVMLLLVLLVAYTTAVLMCHADDDTTFKQVVYDLMLPVPYATDMGGWDAVEFKTYVCVLEILFKLSLCLLLSAFIASVVRKIIHLTPHMDDLYRIHVTKILLLLERRLPRRLRKGGYVEIDGRYYIISSFSQTERGRHTTERDFSDSESEH